MDTEAKKKKLTDLIEGNERSYAEINQRLASHGHPGMTIEVVGPTIDLLITKLVEVGALSEDDTLDMQLELHGQIETGLTEQWVELRNAEARAKLGVQKKQPTLLGPGGQPLRSV